MHCGLYRNSISFLLKDVEWQINFTFNLNHDKGYNIFFLMHMMQEDSCVVVSFDAITTICSVSFHVELSYCAISASLSVSISSVYSGISCL